MAGFNYTKSAQTALRLIDKFGAEATLIRAMPGQGGTEWEPAPPFEAKYSVRFARLPASSSKTDNFGIQIDENLVMQKMRFGYMSVQMTRISDDGPESIIPGPTDVLEFAGEVFTLLGSNTLSPAGVPVYHAVAGKV